MNVKMKVFGLLGLAASLIIILFGCYPKGPEYNSDYSLVVTDYDPEFNFGAQKTYFMPDEVHLETNIENPDKERIEEFEELVLDLVESNMADKGFDRVDTADVNSPDLLISISALAIENTGIGWVPGPCWSWWCWYYPNWYPYGYSYSTGTIIIQLGNPDNSPSIIEDLPVEVRWVAGLDGLLSSSVNNNQQGITNGINQAFAQSPYLKSDL